jgi:hypothetical protein
MCSLWPRPLKFIFWSKLATEIAKSTKGIAESPSAEAFVVYAFFVAKWTAAYNYPFQMNFLI